ncbi:MAG: energy transducer TonB [Spirochaetes bacterium]|nr:energy transducer TonB [Spirochaetota bacterium]
MRKLFLHDDTLPFAFGVSFVFHVILLALIGLFYRNDISSAIGRQTSIVVADDVKFYANPDYKPRSDTSPVTARSGSATVPVRSTARSTGTPAIPSPETLEPETLTPETLTPASSGNAAAAGSGKPERINPDDIVMKTTPHDKTASEGDGQSGSTASGTAAGSGTGTAGSTGKKTKDRLGEFLRGGGDDKSLFAPGKDDGRGKSGVKDDKNDSAIQWDGTSRGKPVASQMPEYPARLKQNGIGGTVVVSIKVSPDGKVYAPIVVKSSGYNEFDRSAVEALRRYRFAAISSERIDTGTITITFSPK